MVDAGECDIKHFQIGSGGNGSGSERMIGNHHNVAVFDSFNLFLFAFCQRVIADKCMALLHKIRREFLNHFRFDAKRFNQADFHVVVTFFLFSHVILLRLEECMALNAVKKSSWMHDFRIAFIMKASEKGENNL